MRCRIQSVQNGTGEGKPAREPLNHTRRPVAPESSRERPDEDEKSCRVFFRKKKPRGFRSAGFFKWWRERDSNPRSALPEQIYSLRASATCISLRVFIPVAVRRWKIRSAVCAYAAPYCQVFFGKTFEIRLRACVEEAWKPDAPERSRVRDRGREASRQDRAKHPARPGGSRVPAESHREAAECRRHRGAAG